MYRMTLLEVLGDAVTPEIAAAWSEVYWLFALQLVAEEARLYQQASVDPAQPTRPYRVVRRIEETADVIYTHSYPVRRRGRPDGARTDRSSTNATQESDLDPLLEYPVALHEPSRRGRR